MKRSNVLDWLVGVFVASMGLTLVIDLYGWLLAFVFHYPNSEHAYLLFPYHRPSITFAVLYFTLVGFFVHDLANGRTKRNSMFVWLAIKRLWSYFKNVTFFMLVVEYFIRKLTAVDQVSVIDLATIWWSFVLALFMLDLISSRTWDKESQERYIWKFHW